MTTIRFATFTGATVLALGMLALSQGANASITSKLQKCIADSRGSAVSCCEQATSDKRPFWMIQANAQCEDVVVCDYRRCWVKQIAFDNIDKKNKRDSGRKER